MVHTILRSIFAICYDDDDADISRYVDYPVIRNQNNGTSAIRVIIPQSAFPRSISNGRTRIFIFVVLVSFGFLCFHIIYVFSSDVYTQVTSVANVCGIIADVNT